MAEELPNLPMYCSVEWADAFFASFLWNTNWTGATQEQKEAALKTATNLIQRYVIFYDDEPSTYFALKAGEAAIFFPDDAHAPLVGDGHVKKCVIKVKC